MKTFFILFFIASIFYFFGRKKQNVKLRKLAIGIFVLAFILLIGTFTGLIKTEKSVEIEAEKVLRRNIIETVSASGKIQPEVEVKISPDVSGEIVELLIKEGDIVQKGELLLKIKPDIYKSVLERSMASVNTAKANLSKSKAQLAENEANFNRNKRLYNQQAISLSEFQQIEVSYKVAKLNVEGSEYAVISAEASLNEAEENLDKTSIYAPVEGSISMLNIELGERVVGTGQMSGTEMMRLADLNAMEVAVEVNENDIIRVHLGDTSIIEVDAFLGEQFTGIYW